MKRKRARQDDVRKRKNWCSAADAAGSGFSHLEQHRHLEVKLTRIDEVFAALRSDPKVALPSQRRARGRTCFCFSCESCIPLNSLARYENRLSKAVSGGQEHLYLQRRNEEKSKKSMKVYKDRDQIDVYKDRDQIDVYKDRDQIDAYKDRDQIDEQKQELGNLKKKQKTFYERKVSALQSRRQNEQRNKKGLNVYKDRSWTEEQKHDVCSSKKRRKIFDDRNVSDQHLQKQNKQKTNITAEVYIDNDLIEEQKPDVRRSRRSRKIFDDRSVSPELNAYLMENIGTTSRTLKCEKCAAVFHTYNSLKYHERLHAQQFPFACSICSQAFCLPLELKEHMDGHIRTIAFTRHAVPVSRNKPSAPIKTVPCGTDFSCKICLRNFRSYQIYEKHCFGGPQERRNHSLYQCFLCESCWYSFITAEQWRKHMVFQHGVLANIRRKCVFKWLLLCQSCDKMFENFCLLRTHFLNVHSGKRRCIITLKPQPAATVGQEQNAAGKLLTEVGQNEGQAFEKTVKGNTDSAIEETLHVEVNGTQNQPQPGAGRWLRVVVSTESTSPSQSPDTGISIDSTSQHPVTGNGIDSTSQHPVIGNGIDSTSQPPDIGVSTPASAALENYNKKAQFIINSGCSYYKCEVHQLKSPSDHLSNPKSDIPSSIHETHKNKNVISAPALLQMINQVKEKSGSAKGSPVKSSSDHSSKPKSDLPSSRHQTHRNKNVTSAPTYLQIISKVNENEKKCTVEREWKLIGDNQFGMNNDSDCLRCPDALKLKVLQIQYENYTQESQKMALDQLAPVTATLTNKAANSVQKQVHQACTMDDVQIGISSLKSNNLSLPEDSNKAADEKEQSNSGLDINTNLVQNDLLFKNRRPGPADHVYRTEVKTTQVNDSKTSVPVKSSIRPVFGCRMCHRAFHTLAELKDHIPKFTAACSGALASNIELLMKDLELKLGEKPGPLTTLDYIRQGVMVAGQKVTTMSASNTAIFPESTPSLTFLCEECKFGFPSWPEFMKHMDYIPEKRPAICQDLAFARGQMTGTSSAAEKESDDDLEFSCSCSWFCDDASHLSPAVDRQSCVGKDIRHTMGKTNRLSSNKALSCDPMSLKQRQKKQQKKGDQDNCPVPMYLVCNDNVAKVEEFDFEYEKTAGIKTQPPSLKSALQNSYEDDDDEQKPDVESLKFTEISFDSDKDTFSVHTMESHPFGETVSVGEMSYAKSDFVPGIGQMKTHSTPSVVSITSAAEDQEMMSDSENESLIMMSNPENDSLWAVYINEDA